MTLKIGDITLESPFLLAPLAGITDAPMRRICKNQGAALVYSEMISAKGLWYKDKNTERLLYMYEDEGPVALQLFGSEPEIMSFVAAKLEERKNVILDVNMGCPVPKVVKNGEGSALLKNPELAGRIIEAMIKETGKPVTAKIRMGWDEHSVNAVEVAKILEQAGASAVAVHGRTREQYYTGKADWECIRAVKEAVNIPVIGNGDVTSASLAEEMLKKTGCDGIMIGRGAEGNPFIFREITQYLETGTLPTKPSPKEVRRTIERHAALQVKYKGEYTGVREMRKHLAWYTTGYPHSAAYRQMINHMETMEELLKSLDMIFPAP